MKIKKQNIIELPIESLSFLSFNRVIKESVVMQLANSMEQYGMLRTPVVCINKSISGKKETYILDGQHMITALIRAGVSDIECIVTEIETSEDMVKVMAILNNIVSKWQLTNYIHAFASLGNPNYLRIKQFMLTQGFTAPIAALILGSKNYKAIKTGKFKANNKDAVKLTEYVNDCCIVLGTKKSRFIEGFVNFYRNDKEFKYNHPKMLKLLAKVDDVQLLTGANSSFIKQTLDDMYVSGKINI